MAAKQRPESNVNPSLLWRGGRACCSAVCAPVQTSSAVAAGYQGGAVGRVCLRTTEAGGQIALRSTGRGGAGKGVRGGAGWREGGRAGGVLLLARTQRPRSARLI